MYLLKILAIIGVVVMLTGWSVVPALVEESPEQQIEVTCSKEGDISVSSREVELSQFAKERVKWVFNGSSTTSVFGCKVGEETLRKLGLNKVEIDLKPADFLILMYPEQPLWEEGRDYTIEGKIRDEPIIEDITIQYSIRFYSYKENTKKLLLEKKGFTLKLIPARECRVHTRPDLQPLEYNSISEALKAQPRMCERIKVEPGEYTENVTISGRDRPLEIKFVEEGTDFPRIVAKGVGQVFFLDRVRDVTIEGLSISGADKKLGVTGVLIQNSRNIKLLNLKIFGNAQAGIRINQVNPADPKDSNPVVTLEGVEVYNNHDGIVIKDSQNVTIKHSSSKKASIMHHNMQYGVSVENAKNIVITNTEITNNDWSGLVVSKSTVTLKDSQISDNKANGVFLLDENSKIVLGKNEIFRNGTCGISGGTASTVIADPPYSNIITGNRGGDPSSDICAPKGQIPGSLRKFTAIVPKHFPTISKALEGTKLYAEEIVAASRDGIAPLFIIQVEPGTYKDNLCIRRPVRLQSLGRVNVQGDGSNPVIRIGTDNCLFEDPSNYSVIIIDGFAISGGSVGVQVGPGLKNSPVKLKIKLDNIVITGNIGQGILIKADEKDDLDIQITGGQTWVFLNLSCDKVDLRNPKQLPPQLSSLVQQLSESATTKIYDNNGDEVTLEVSDQAKVSATLSHAIIGNVTGEKPSQGSGIVLKSTGESSVILQLNTVWIANNSKHGLEVTADQANKKPNVDINVVAGSSIYGNGSSGIKVNNPTISMWSLSIVDTVVTNNGGHGIELGGQLLATLTTSESIFPQQPQKQELTYYCGFFANKGSGLTAGLGPDIETAPGIRQPAQAQVKIEKLRVEKNQEHGVVVKNLNILQGFALQLADSQISENSGSGLLLGSLIEGRFMLSLINNNRFESNKLWGVTRYIKSCLIDHEDIPSESYWGQEHPGDERNAILKNGESLGRREIRAGYERQVCPPQLQILLGKP